MTLRNVVRSHGTIWGGSTEPFWCELGAVGKTNDVHPHVVANEYICTRLAALAAVPAAHGAVLRAEDAGPDGLVFVSFVAYPAGIDAPAPPTGGILARQPKLCAAAVVFDCWVMNEDRHRDNVVYAPTLNVPFTLIDFEGALLANDRDVTDAKYLQSHQMGGQLHQWVTSRDHLEYWKDRIRQVPDAAVRRILDEAAAFGALTRDDVEKADAALKYRKDNISALLDKAENDGRMLHLTGDMRLPL